MIEANKGLPKWRQAVTQAAILAHDGEPLDVPVRVRVVFVMPRPKRPRFPVPAVHPDTDKMQRAIGDSLEAAGVLRNDSRIVHWDARKIYATEHEPTGAHVAIEELTNA